MTLLLKSETGIEICWFYFLSTPNINVLELNCKRPIVTRQWHCAQTSVYPLTAVTEVAKLISKCTLTDRLPQKPLPELQFCLTMQGAKSIIFRFHHLMTSNLVLLSILFFTNLPVIILTNTHLYCKYNLVSYVGTDVSF
jgi:hypothetical protein